MHLLPDQPTAQGTGACARFLGVDLKTGLFTYACTVWTHGSVFTATLQHHQPPTLKELTDHLFTPAAAPDWTHIAPSSSNHV